MFSLVINALPKYELYTQINRYSLSFRPSTLEKESSKFLKYGNTKDVYGLNSRYGIVRSVIP